MSHPWAGLAVLAAIHHESLWTMQQCGICRAAKAPMPVYTEMPRWPLAHLPPPEPLHRRGLSYPAGDSHRRSAVSRLKQNMGHYVLKINFLSIVHWCHLLGGNVTARNSTASTLASIGPLQQQSHRMMYGAGVGQTCSLIRQLALRTQAMAQSPCKAAPALVPTQGTELKRLQQFHLWG